MWVRVLAFLVLSVGLGICVENASKGPYWRDVKYGKKGFSYHGLKFGGVYTDADFQFPDDSQKRLDGSRHSVLDENNSLVSHTVPAQTPPQTLNHTDGVLDVHISNDIDDHRDYVPALEKQSHIIDPPAIISEPSVEQKAQEIVYVGKVDAKDEGPTRGDTCIQCETKPLFVRDTVDKDETQIDDVQYTTKPTFVTEHHIDDVQYTTKPTFVTEHHIDDVQYTTQPTFVTEHHIDDVQYTTKPTFVTEHHIDDTQYTTNDVQYTTKPTFVTEHHIDDVQYTTQPTFVTEHHIDDAQYTTKPTFVDDSQYTTQPTFVTEHHVDDSQYTTQPTFVTEHHVDDSQYTTVPTFFTEHYVDDSQYTTVPTFVKSRTEKSNYSPAAPEPTKTPYVHKTSTSYDEWVWETRPTTQKPDVFTTKLPTLSTIKIPTFLFHPLVPVNPIERGVKFPPVLVPQNHQGPGGYSGVEFHNSGSKGFEYTIDHGSVLKPQVPITSSYPSFNYHTVTSAEPTEQPFTTEFPKGHKNTHFHTTIVPEIQYSTQTPEVVTFKDTREETTPHSFIRPTLYPIFPVTDLDNTNVKGIRKHLTTEVPLTVKPIYDIGIPTTIKPHYNTEIPLKGDHPTTIEPHTPSTTVRHLYDVTTPADKYDVPTTQPTIFITKRPLFITDRPVVYETTPTFIGNDNTVGPHISTTTVEPVTKGFSIKLYPVPHESTTEIHKEIYTTQKSHSETTPFFTAEVPIVKIQPTTYIPITTEVPVIKEQTTNHPRSTTKATGIKGHRRFFITASTTDQPTTQRVRNIKGGRRFSFVIPESNENPILPSVRKTGLKGFRRFGQATTEVIVDASVPTFELSEELSSDKDERLSRGTHFYFAPRREVRDVADRKLQVDIVNDKSKLLTKSETYNSESLPRELQKDVKGHATYDVKRPDIKGRGGDRWKKYFTFNHLLSSWGI